MVGDTQSLLCDGVPAFQISLQPVLYLPKPGPHSGPDAGTKGQEEHKLWGQTGLGSSSSSSLASLDRSGHHSELTLLPSKTQNQALGRGSELFPKPIAQGLAHGSSALSAFSLTSRQILLSVCFCPLPALLKNSIQPSWMFKDGVCLQSQILQDEQRWPGLGSGEGCWALPSSTGKSVFVW